jgi:hypothetical protein
MVEKFFELSGIARKADIELRNGQSGQQAQMTKQSVEGLRL